MYRIASVFFLSIAAASAEAAQINEARASQFQTLALERSQQNDLLVRAFINGKPALLCVDTGAPMSAIASDRVRYFGLTTPRGNSEMPARVPFNGGQYNLAVAHSLQLGSLNLVDEPLVALDLHNASHAARLMGERAVDGVIGADILFPTKAVLDCSAQMLTMKMNPTVRGVAPGVDYTGFRSIPIHVTGNNLYVDGNFNGRRGKLMIDTGAFGTLLHRRFVNDMKIPLRKTDFNSSGVNFTSGAVQRATIDRFSLGAVEMRGKVVGVANLEGLFHAALLEGKMPVAGLLGADILALHNGIIDFGTRTLYLKEHSL
ncbi:MAG: pepsin/retropepsin-like aspartic protease family protein [Verrucomicrobiota bacterium]|nr:pepsin/retropepsin-like aspartic protease family protein [Verrucomicrobiota bacterium]